MGEHNAERDGAPLSTLVLDVHDLVAVVAEVGLDSFMDEMIATLRTSIGAFDDRVVEHQVRSGFSYHTPEHGMVEWMPTMVTGDVVSVKTVGYHPANPVRRGIPSVLATTALYDTRTGRLMAMCEATLLTAIRTGAASAVVTDATTHHQPISLGVVGCGAQAVTQIHAIRRVRTIDRLVVTDTDAVVANSLWERLPDGVVTPEVVSLDEFNARVGTFDVVCTCTSVPIGHPPVADLSRARPNLHVNAVGADFPGKTELPLEYLKSAVVIPDLAEQCMIEGESQRLRLEDLGPSMVDVVGGKVHGLAAQRTVFDSTGWSYEDLLAAQLFLGHAQRLGLGTTIDLQLEPNDPYDPYEMVRFTVAQRSIQSSASVREIG
jgi:ornithine cyclodeaminase/alanine dehydrogenase-like protein (mu-crystallin family)